MELGIGTQLTGCVVLALGNCLGTRFCCKQMNENVMSYNHLAEFRVNVDTKILRP